MLKDLLNRAILIDPLSRSLITHTGNTRKIIGLLPHQRSHIRVILRKNPVTVLHRGSVHRRDIRNPAHRIQNQHVIVDQLERVPITRDNQDIETIRSATGRQRRQNVISLIALIRQRRDVHSGHDLIDQLDLARELRRSLGAATLIFLILLRTDSRPRKVKRDRNMGRFPLLNHFQQHRNETVNRVRVLARSSREVLCRQSEKRAERHRMPIDNEQTRLGFGRRRRFRRRRLGVGTHT